MAQENVIKKRAKEILEAEGYVVWSAAKAIYASSDIFGIFDGIAAKRGEVNSIRFIQWTSLSNMSARRRKMRNFFLEHKLFIDSELWGYEGGKFKVEKALNPLI